MKRFIILFFALQIILFSMKPLASDQEYTVVAKLEDDDITIYAKKANGFYEDFRIDYKGHVYERPLWKNVTNPTYGPQIVYEDINEDGKKEIIVILTTGYGTGVLEEEVIVFHQNKDQSLREVLVDNPMAIVYKNVKSKLNTDKAEIRIDENNYEVNMKKSISQPENLFENIFFGSIIKYEVKDKKLLVNLHPMVAPSVFIGTLIITYEYRQNMYQAKSIEFQLE